MSKTLKILFLTTLISCSNGGLKEFESSRGWFELKYPLHWTQFEEDEGTYLFMDNKDWKGNLRITAMRMESKNEKLPAKNIEVSLNEELIKRQGSKLIKLRDKEAVFWINNVEQDGDSLLIYNWLIGNKGTLFVCSFAIDKDKADQKEVKEELNFAIKTLESIKVN